MRILAIETSCDETSIAILEADKKGDFKILSNIVSSQIKIHAPFGGVVPMLAKREHQKNLVPILKQSLKEAGLLLTFDAPLSASRRSGACSGNKLINILDREPELFKKILPFLKKYQKPDIDYIAVTHGPGLEPALWVGINFAKALGYAWNLPIITVNHVEAHIIANWLTSGVIASHALRKGHGVAIPRNTTDQGITASPPTSPVGGRINPRNNAAFPAITLIVSGGHTQIILMKDFGDYKVLGETRDDAAGEAFDKLARMLNLGYPGGPIVARLANQYKSLLASLSLWRSGPASLSKGRRSPSFLKEGWAKSPEGASPLFGGGFNNIVKLPRPMINSNDYDFSFSGLKTAALYLIKTLSPAQIKKLTPAICAEFQQAVVDVLILKTIRAAKEFNAKTILLSGGVASNDLLRETLKRTTYSLSEAKGRVEGSKINFSVPDKEFCTDNAAMIALTAYSKLFPKRARHILDWEKIQADGNLRLT